jgi:PAS domain S-box-containing protein
LAKQHQSPEFEEKINRLSYEAWLATMMNDASIDRVMALDTDLAIIAWNKKNEEVTGIAREDVIGSKFYDVFPQASQHRGVANALNNSLAGRTVYLPAYEGSYDGGYYENHFLPLRNDEGSVIGIMNIKHDVAHRIKAENELKALNKALVRKNKELKQRGEELLSFSQVTGHDLKEPLRKIYIFIEMIAQEEGAKLSDKSKTHFKRIQAAVQRMGILTDDVLAFTEINTERLQEVDVDLEQTMQFVMGSLLARIEDTSAVIRYHDLPVVKGYRQLISQLFHHLIGNALKFRKANTVPVIRLTHGRENGSNISHPDAQPDTHYMRISIEDNGMGFEEIYRDKIFQMFQKLNKDEYPGTGIGLALCKKIAYMHQGFITANSEKDKGSTFSIYLPTK